MHMLAMLRAYVRAEFARKLASCGGALPLAGCRAGGPDGLRVAGQLAKNNEKQEKVEEKDSSENRSGALP